MIGTHLVLILFTVVETDSFVPGGATMNITIKPVAANLIRQMAERYPDLRPAEVARKGGWTIGQVQSALRAKAPDKPRSRVG